MVASGRDPLADRQEKKRKSLATVELLLQRYDADLERRGYVNRRVVIGGLNARMRPLLNRDVSEITGREIADILARIQALVGKRGVAAFLREAIRQRLELDEPK